MSQKQLSIDSGYIAKDTLDFLYPVNILEAREEERHIKGVIVSLVKEAQDKHNYFTLAVGRN